MSSPPPNKEYSPDCSFLYLFLLYIRVSIMQRDKKNQLLLKENRVTLRSYRCMSLPRFHLKIRHFYDIQIIILNGETGLLSHEMVTRPNNSSSCPWGIPFTSILSMFSVSHLVIKISTAFVRVTKLFKQT